MLKPKTLMSLISRGVEGDSITCSGTWKNYTGIAARGRVHRRVEHGKDEYTDKQDIYMSGLAGFWGKY